MSACPHCGEIVRPGIACPCRESLRARLVADLRDNPLAVACEVVGAVLLFALLWLGWAL